MSDFFKKLYMDPPYDMYDNYKKMSFIQDYGGLVSKPLTPEEDKAFQKVWNDLKAATKGHGYKIQPAAPAVLQSTHDEVISEGPVGSMLKAVALKQVELSSKQVEQQSMPDIYLPSYSGKWRDVTVFDNKITFNSNYEVNPVNWTWEHKTIKGGSLWDTVSPISMKHKPEYKHLAHRRGYRECFRCSSTSHKIVYENFTFYVYAGGGHGPTVETAEVFDVCYRCQQREPLVDRHQAEVQARRAFAGMYSSLEMLDLERVFGQGEAALVSLLGIEQSNWRQMKKDRILQDPILNSKLEVIAKELL